MTTDNLKTTITTALEKLADRFSEVEDAACSMERMRDELQEQISDLQYKIEQLEDMTCQLDTQIMSAVKLMDQVERTSEDVKHMATEDAIALAVRDLIEHSDEELQEFEAIQVEAEDIR
jgi:predicted nuclease with TOPRIM domain